MVPCSGALLDFGKRPLHQLTRAPSIERAQEVHRIGCRPLENEAGLNELAADERHAACAAVDKCALNELCIGKALSIDPYGLSMEGIPIHGALSRRTGVIFAEGVNSKHASPVGILSHIRHALGFDLRQPDGIHVPVKVDPLPTAPTTTAGKERLHDRS
jgi:hypothetical protein